MTTLSDLRSVPEQSNRRGHKNDRHAQQEPVALSHRSDRIAMTHTTTAHMPSSPMMANQTTQLNHCPALT